MNIQKNISLKNYSTMRLGGKARYLCEVSSLEDLGKALTWAKQQNTTVIVIGDGSNIVWQDSGFPGLVIVNKLSGITMREIGGTQSAQFTFSAGENWDAAVKYTVKLGYSGLERLSLIPGTCGAAPVQNIGAYGSEIKDTLISVRAYDNQDETFVTLTNQDCQFGYRSSIFNQEAKGRYVIVSITVKLTKEPPKPPFYASLQEYLDTRHITDHSVRTIREAVIAIRRSKLPDPTQVANNGSFFGNPIIDSAHAKKLQQQYPDMPSWPVADNKTKLSAAWLIEQAGFTKGYQDAETGMALWQNQALVLVNEHAQSTTDLLSFKKKITDAVKQKLDVELKQEPELI
jgi:UDP-N-acetylmuramate dehydrogenase